MAPALAPFLAFRLACLREVVILPFTEIETLIDVVTLPVGSEGRTQLFGGDAPRRCPPVHSLSHSDLVTGSLDASRSVAAHHWICYGGCGPIDNEWGGSYRGEVMYGDACFGKRRNRIVRDCV